MGRWLVRGLVVAIATSVLVVGSIATTNVISCVSEDQHWCIWYSGDVGNGTGNRYVDLGGYVVEF